jgi:hypothetical protein
MALLLSHDGEGQPSLPPVQHLLSAMQALPQSLKPSPQLFPQRSPLRRQRVVPSEQR